MGLQKTRVERRNSKNGQTFQRLEEWGVGFEGFLKDTIFTGWITFEDRRTSNLSLMFCSERLDFYGFIAFLFSGWKLISVDFGMGEGSPNRNWVFVASFSGH